MGGVFHDYNNEGYKTVLSKYTSSDDSWFIGVNTVEKVATEVVYYCGTVQKVTMDFIEISWII